MNVHHLPGRGFDSNIFLVTGEDPFLIDAGTGANTQSVLDWIEKLMDSKNIGRIILTHRHYDHVGGAAKLARALGATVLIHELDAEPIANGDSWGTQASMFGEAMEAVEVESLKEGDIISTGERDFLIMHTPGHSVGSLSLFCEGDGTLISGDTVFVGGVGRWDLPTGDYDDLIGSLIRLGRLEVKDLYPGHGPCAKGNALWHLRDALGCLGES
ncbi:MAG: MBL fold metallo-hydrolase [Methanomassiliicoccales archaeon]|nr:MBL fold metallo-hydrolase [Methanomassiliicoccales archaeon]NYT14690.1 MBL fold metallo-hydrolase [Methanomassiliicoccales archaeon]